LPRSPLIATATRDLALYFQAITDASFIDRSWAIKGQKDSNRGALASATALNDGKQTTNADAAVEIFDKLTRTGLINASGTPEADHVSNLINGAVGIGSYLAANGQIIPSGYTEQFKLYCRDADNDDKLKMVEFNSLDKASPGKISAAPSIENPNVYAANVYNPFLGPTTRDTGPIEIFMNAIPTLEFSRCVPYINLDVITTRKEVGDTAGSPSLSMIGFLNPSARGTADNAMLGAQATRVASEATDLGIGIKSGIELFVMPQTLVNLGDTASEFTPVIDRLRPLASIDNFSLSTKLQGGTLAFTTGRIEITVFDRSRLREVAAFVRPDLYGTTFLDITHGWSHPDGGMTSSNTFGKFLNALKTETRYRVSNSSYTFEEGGKIKITLSVQSMGSIDLLYLGPSKVSQPLKELNQVVRALNAAIAEAKNAGTTTDVKQFDFINTIKSPNDALSAAAGEEGLKKIKEALNNKKIKDPEIKELLIKLWGDLAKNTGAVGDVQTASSGIYTAIINNLPVLLSTTDEKNSTGVAGDPFATEFISDSFNRFAALNDNNVITVDDDAGTFAKTKGFLDQLNYVSYGSAFMKMVVDPLKASKQYDEIQTVFYPFNSFAGAVHDLPISCFPIEKDRLIKAVTEFSKKVPDISSQQMIAIFQDKFTGYKASRAYLMTGFYNTDKTDASQDVEALDRFTAGTPIKKATGTGTPATTAPKPATTPPVAPAPAAPVAPAPAAPKPAVTYAKGKAIDSTKTFEKRLKEVGIPELKFVMPRVEVAVEASKLLDQNGFPITDDRGNTKTLLKIHVYDASMDPHQTLTDIISASNDSGLGIIAVPVANFNAAVVGDKSDKNLQTARDKYGITAVINAGIEKGLLEAIDIKTGLPVSSEKATADAATNATGGIYLRIKDNYAQVKELVSAGMPTITYGSSMSAVTSAALATGGNAALSNVLLQRAFAAPGEAAPDNVDSGVPMQITPASLSISTFGCPLFYPMQRFFVDFGTGTSIDSAYFVVSTESTIGSSGYKTDLKLSYSAGFATYVSLNQNLAMLAANFSSATGATMAAPAASSATAVSATTDSSSQSKVAAQEAAAAEAKAKIEVARVATEVEKAIAAAELEITTKINEEKTKIELIAKAKAADIAKKLQAKLDKALGVPESLKIKAQEAKKEALVAKDKVDELVAKAQKAKEIADMAARLLGLKDLVSPEYFVAEIDKAKAVRLAAEADSKRAIEAFEAAKKKKSE
jgi:hypothetical protein